MFESDEALAQRCMAVLTNRFIAGMDTYITRIAFLEKFPNGNAEVRTCVCMTTADAIQLYHMLGELIAKTVNNPKEKMN